MTLSFKIHGTCALALAFLVAPAEAGAREIEYRVPAGCPDASGVVSRIETRAPRGGPARFVIQKTKNGFHGDLVVGDGERRLARSVDARSCGAVVEALELVLALNSDAEEAPQASDDVVIPHQTAAAAEQPAIVAPSPPGATFTIGSGVSSSSFSEGRVLFGGALFADVALPTRIGGVSFLQPSFRVSLGGTFPNTSDDSGAVTTFAKSAFDVCPVGANLEGAVGLMACGRGELGARFHSGNGIPWVAAGPVMRSRFMWHRDATWRPSFEVTAGLLAPLHQLKEIPVPTWTWTVGMGVGVVFP